MKRITGVLTAGAVAVGLGLTLAGFLKDTGDMQVAASSASFALIITWVGWLALQATLQEDDGSAVRMIVRPESLPVRDVDGIFHSTRELFIAVQVPPRANGTVSLKLPDNVRAVPVTRVNWVLRGEHGPWEAAIRDGGFHDLGTFSFSMTTAPADNLSLTIGFVGDQQGKTQSDSVEVVLYEAVE